MHFCLENVNFGSVYFLEYQILTIEFRLYIAQLTLFFVITTKLERCCDMIDYIFKKKNGFILDDENFS